MFQCPFEIHFHLSELKYFSHWDAVITRRNAVYFSCYCFGCAACRDAKAIAKDTFHLYSVSIWTHVGWAPIFIMTFRPRLNANAYFCVIRYVNCYHFHFRWSHFSRICPHSVSISHCMLSVGARTVHSKNFGWKTKVAAMKQYTKKAWNARIFCLLVGRCDKLSFVHTATCAKRKPTCVSFAHICICNGGGSGVCDRAGK